MVPGADPVNRVTIVPRGQALGVTYQRPDSDRYNYPEAYLRARIVGMLGGRAAEEIVYGTKTTGAESDIEQATGIARRMVTRWGMSERVGLVELAPRENPYLRRHDKFAALKIFLWLREQKSCLQREDMFTIQILMKTVVVAWSVLQKKRCRF